MTTDDEETRFVMIGWQAMLIVKRMKRKAEACASAVYDAGRMKTGVAGELGGEPESGRDVVSIPTKYRAVFKHR